jgi:hypothetical protein
MATIADPILPNLSDLKLFLFGMNKKALQGRGPSAVCPLTPETHQNIVKE